MIVGEEERRLEIKGFLMAGAFFLAQDTYVFIARYAFFDVRELLHLLNTAMSRGANISPLVEDVMK
jgi:hypothetical protein